jgi:glycosyltransferase involved in cell wall biosynthesis
MASPIISIVLTTYNSEKVIKPVLDGILSQDFPLNKVELIIVDGGSKDDTLNIIRDFAKMHKDKFYDVKIIIHDKNYGISRARNDGIKASEGRYILILDHDVIIPSNTIKALLEHLESVDKKVGAVIPLHKPLCGDILTRWEYEIRKGRISKTNAITSCALMRKQLTNEIGLYDESLGPPFTIYEDIEYGARALSKGYEIHLIGTIEVLHNTCEETETKQNSIIKPKRASKICSKFMIFLSIIRSLANPKYRYALKKYLRSSPKQEKLRWLVYLALIILFIPLIVASILLKSGAPMLVWLISLMMMYMDILRQYWNKSILHISLVYSAIALMWRLTRSIMLIF